jgi:hypothetical protein
MSKEEPKMNISGQKHGRGTGKTTIKMHCASALALGDRIPDQKAAAVVTAISKAHQNKRHDREDRKSPANSRFQCR